MEEKSCILPPEFTSSTTRNSQSFFVWLPHKKHPSLVSIMSEPAHKRRKKLNLSEIRIFYNNINGFVSKRQIFLNSQVFCNHDIILLQETNIDADKHINYDNWGQGWSCINLTTVDTSSYRRGMMVGVRDGIDFSVKKRFGLCQNFEIAVISIKTAKPFSIVLAYKSPSMSHEKTEDYFQNLLEIASSLTQAHVIIGDLNISRGRRGGPGVDQGMFIDMFLDSGYESVVNSATRLNTQLDYLFSNFEISAEVQNGFLSDHKSFSITVQGCLEPVWADEKWTRVSKAIDEVSIKKIMNMGIDQLIEYQSENQNLEIGRVLVELDNLAYEIAESCPLRKIKGHFRVPGTSRQVSEVLLNNDLETEEKEKALEKALAADAARLLAKKCRDASTTAKSLYSICSMSTKNEAQQSCKIPADAFLQKILKQEARVDHSTHPPVIPIPNMIRPPDLDSLLPKIRLKYADRRYFTSKTWNFLAKFPFTKEDKGIFHELRAETVVKDKTNLEDPKGWRIVWKSGGFQKYYNALRAAYINSTEIDNDAYTADRSIIKTLTSVCSWEPAEDEGLLGVDLEDAFALLCRQCLNEIVGEELLPRVINFTVATDAGATGVHRSVVGSGAGTSVGGPAFNIGIESQLSKPKHPRELVENISWKEQTAEFDSVVQDIRFILSDFPKTQPLQPASTKKFADDGLKLIKADRKELEDCFEVFDATSDVGLIMHKHPTKKGPALLVAEKAVPKLSNDLGDICKIESCIKFLGRNLYLMDQKVVAKALSSSISTMNFFMKEVRNGLNLCREYFKDDPIKLKQVEFNASQAVSCFIESRIQDGILFCDSATLRKYYAVHRQAITALVGFPPSFFGFRPIRPPKKNSFISDLYDEITELGSPTYIRLAEIAGRPSLYDLAYRAVKVAITQSRPDSEGSLRSWSKNFFSKRLLKLQDDLEIRGPIHYPMKPKDNQHHCFWKQLSLDDRRLFVKISTNRFFRSEQVLRGFEVSPLCRVCEKYPETLKHYFDLHHSSQVSFKMSEIRRIFAKETGRAPPSMKFKFFKEFKNWIPHEATPPRKRKTDNDRSCLGKKRRTGTQ